MVLNGVNNFLNDHLVLFNDHFDFEDRGLVLSKKVSLRYSAVNQQPWLYFDCLDHRRYSFQVHELELGQSEAPYWFMVAAKKDKNIRLEGFVNKMYSRGLGSLIGYLEVPEDHHMIGVIIVGDRVHKIRTQEQIRECTSCFISSLSYILKLKEEVESLERRVRDNMGALH